MVFSLPGHFFREEVRDQHGKMEAVPAGELRDARQESADSAFAFRLWGHVVEVLDDEFLTSREALAPAGPGGHLLARRE